MPNYFHKIGKKYYLTDHLGVLIQAMDEIGLAFEEHSSGEIELVRYGSSESVRAWYLTHQDDYAADAPMKLIVMYSNTWSEKELNQLLSNDSYAKIFYYRMVEKCQAQQRSTQNLLSSNGSKTSKCGMTVATTPKIIKDKET